MMFVKCTIVLCLLVTVAESGRSTPVVSVDELRELLVASVHNLPCRTGRTANSEKGKGMNVNLSLIIIQNKV